MQRFLAMLLCLVVPTLTIAAPADSTMAPSHPNSLQAGMWALQFDVNGELLSVDSFSGGLSIKRQFAPTWALRFGVGFSGSGATTNPDVNNRPGVENSDDRYSVSLESVYQRYFNPDAIVNAYLGVGPLASYSHSFFEASGDSTRTKGTRNEWRVGAIVSFGAEWFFAKQFSLHGEYFATVRYFEQEEEFERRRLGLATSYDRLERNGWSFGTSDAVRLGLSVYF